MTTITTSRCGVMIDALVAALKASSAFADPIKVYDGPTTAGDTMYTQAVYVGFDGNWQTDSAGNTVAGAHFEAALINQEMRYLGVTTMSEELEIRCVVEGWSGDPNAQTARNLALSTLGGVEKVIRTDPTVGVDGATITTVQTGTLYYVFDNGGNLGARIPFVVHVQTTLMTVT